MKYEAWRATFQSSEQAARAAYQELQAARALTLGVGDGSGELFVHGDHASIKACQRKFLALERAEQQVHTLKCVVADLRTELEGFAGPEPLGDVSSMGMLTLAETEETYRRALLVTFESDEEISAALTGRRCRFTVFGRGAR